jgi:hypothetical protein
MRIEIDKNNRITAWDSLDSTGIQVPFYAFEHTCTNYKYEDGNIIYAPDIERALREAKWSKLSEVNNTAQSFVERVTRADEVPQFEKDTWPEQRREALAWKVDPTASTPTIDGIAADRGIDVNELRERAYGKAVKFAEIVNKVAGQRQKYGDRIDAASSVEELNFEVGYEV